MQNDKPLFTLGRLYVTPGALETFIHAGEELFSYLHRHLTGDWSEMAAEDQRANRLAVKEGMRVFSAYRLHTGVKIWIITEADRSATTALLPAEY